MYSRRPDQMRQGIKIPENYSGHAFREPNPYGDMPPPARIDIPPTERREATVTPQSEEPIRYPSADFTPPEAIAEEISHKPLQEEMKKPIEEAKQSPISSLIPTGIASSSHFPFGHGLGGEELLIMAMMLLVLLSGKDGGESDHELLLLLGLLLFAG